MEKMKLNTSSSLISSIINEKLNGYIDVLDNYIISNPEVIKYNGHIDHDIGKKVVLSLNNIDGVLESWITLPTGNTYGVIDGKFIQNEGFNAKNSNREWFVSVFEKEAPFNISSPYKNVEQAHVIAITHPILRGNKVIGSLSYSIPVLYISNFLNLLPNASNLTVFTDLGFSVRENEYFNVGDNVFKTEPQYKTLSKNNPYIEWTSKNEEDKGIKYSAYYHDIGNIGWNVLSWSMEKNVLKDKNNLLITISITAVLLLLIFLFTSFYFLRKNVFLPIGGEPTNIQNIVKDISSGLFNSEIKKTGKETGIYLSVITLTERLPKVINTSVSIAHNVTSSSEELAVVMKGTAKNMNDEAEQIEQVSTAISELSSTSKEVSLNAVQAEEEANKALGNVSLGHEAIEQSIVLTDNINHSVHETSRILKELNMSASEVGEVMSVINSISEQTNLLALNAAIEAARAGEHGRGFSVVADEVRKLAAKTQGATQEILDIVSSLQERTEKANSNMSKNITLIQDSVELSEKVKSSFGSIHRSVKSISDINTLVATASQEQSSVTEEIAQNTTRAFDLVNKNVVAVNQTQQATDALASLAEQQKKELSFFKIN